MKRNARPMGVALVVLAAIVAGVAGQSALSTVMTATRSFADSEAPGPLGAVVGSGSQSQTCSLVDFPGVLFVIDSNNETGSGVIIARINSSDITSSVVNLDDAEGTSVDTAITRPTAIACDRQYVYVAAMNATTPRIYRLVFDDVTLAIDGTFDITGATDVSELLVVHSPIDTVTILLALGNSEETLYHLTDATTPSVEANMTSSEVSVAGTPAPIKAVCVDKTGTFIQLLRGGNVAIGVRRYPHDPQDAFYVYHEVAATDTTGFPSSTTHNAFCAWYTADEENVIGSYSNSLSPRTPTPLAMFKSASGSGILGHTHQITTPATKSFPSDHRTYTAFNAKSLRSGALVVSSCAPTSSSNVGYVCSLVNTTSNVYGLYAVAVSGDIVTFSGTSLVPFWTTMVAIDNTTSSSPWALATSPLDDGTVFAFNDESRFTITTTESSREASPPVLFTGATIDDLVEAQPTPGGLIPVLTFVEDAAFAFRLEVPTHLADLLLENGTIRIQPATSDALFTVDELNTALATTTSTNQYLSLLSGHVEGEEDTYSPYSRIGPIDVELSDLRHGLYWVQGVKNANLTNPAGMVASKTLVFVEHIDGTGDEDANILLNSTERHNASAVAPATSMVTGETIVTPTFIILWDESTATYTTLLRDLTATDAVAEELSETPRCLSYHEAMSNQRLADEVDDPEVLVSLVALSSTDTRVRLWAINATSGVIYALATGPLALFENSGYEDIHWCGALPHPHPALPATATIQHTFSVIATMFNYVFVSSAMVTLDDGEGGYGFGANIDDDSTLSPANLTPGTSYGATKKFTTAPVLPKKTYAIVGSARTVLDDGDNVYNLSNVTTASFASLACSLIGVDSISCGPVQPSQTTTLDAGVEVIRPTRTRTGAVSDTLDNWGATYVAGASSAVALIAHPRLQMFALINENQVRIYHAALSAFPFQPNAYMQTSDFSLILTHVFGSIVDCTDAVFVESALFVACGSTLRTYRISPAGNVVYDAAALKTYPSTTPVVGLSAVEYHPSLNRLADDVYVTVAGANHTFVHRYTHDIVTQAPTGFEVHGGVQYGQVNVTFVLPEAASEVRLTWLLDYEDAEEEHYIVAGNFNASGTYHVLVPGVSTTTYDVLIANGTGLLRLSYSDAHGNSHSYEDSEGVETTIITVCGSTGIFSSAMLLDPYSECTVCSPRFDTTGLEDDDCSVCADGFHSATTDVDISLCMQSAAECRADRCDNHGACHTDAPFVSGRQCTCDSGYFGHECELDIDECSDTRCSGTGLCASTTGGYTSTCTCQGGATGDLCTTCPGNFLHGDLSCTAWCKPGYYGVGCTLTAPSCTGATTSNCNTCVNLEEYNTTDDSVLRVRATADRSCNVCYPVFYTAQNTCASPSLCGSPAQGNASSASGCTCGTDRIFDVDATPVKCVLDCDRGTYNQTSDACDCQPGITGPLCASGNLRDRASETGAGSGKEGVGFITGAALLVVGAVAVAAYMQRKRSNGYKRGRTAPRQKDDVEF